MNNRPTSRLRRAAAIIAGLSFTLVPGIFQTYLPTSWGNVPTLLFGLGAVAVAVHPDGQVAMNVRTVQGLVVKMIERRRHGTSGAPPGQSAAKAASDGTDVAEVLETSP